MENISEFAGGVIRKLSIGLGFGDKDQQLHLTVGERPKRGQVEEDPKSPPITAIIEDKAFYDRTGGSRYLALIKDPKNADQEIVWKKIENMPCVVEYNWKTE